MIKQLKKNLAATPMTNKVLTVQSCKHSINFIYIFNNSSIKCSKFITANIGSIHSSAQTINIYECSRELKAQL